MPDRTGKLVELWIKFPLYKVFKAQAEDPWDSSIGEVIPEMDLIYMLKGSTKSKHALSNGQINELRAKFPVGLVVSKPITKLHPYYVPNHWDKGSALTRHVKCFVRFHKVLLGSNLYWVDQDSFRVCASQKLASSPDLQQQPSRNQQEAL